MEFSSGIKQKAQKCIVYGPEGIGKSSFAAKFPQPVFIDTEDSTWSLDVKRTPKPTSWAMLMEQIKWFKANPGACQTLIIDTTDWAEMLCIADICATKKVSGIEDIGYGRGYVYLAEEFGRLLNQLNELIELGINVVMTAHATVRKFELPDELGSFDKWELKLQKKTGPMVKEWADLVLFCNYKTYVVNTDGQGAEKGTNKAQGGKRVMYTTHHPCWDAKNRQDLPDMLDFDYKEIAFMFPTREIKAPTQTTTQQPADPVPPSAPATPSQPFDQAVGWNDVGTEVGRERRDGTVDWNIPKPLLDLMKPNNVTPAEIQWVVAHKGNGGRGYYPEDMPISKYDPAFIEGVLIAAWPKIYAFIEEKRQTEDEIPF